MKTQNAPQSWEIKDRLYVLKSGIQPLVFTLPSRHTGRKSLLWFDEETGVQKEIRYATNQASPLVEEQKGSATLGHIVFRDGTLQVPKQKQNLQKLLSLYHPLSGKRFTELDNVEIARDEVYDIELEIFALTAE